MRNGHDLRLSKQLPCVSSPALLATGIATTLAACGPAPITEPSPELEGSTTGAQDPRPPVSDSTTHDAPPTTSGQASTTGDDAPEQTTSSQADTSSTESSTTEPAPTACAKVDFLVVIDHSQPMTEEQGRILTSFPTLLESLAAGPFALDDVHILVTDTDAWVFEDCFDDPCPFCPEAFECATEPLPCEDVIGAGITHPRGLGAGNTACDFTSGGRYIDATEPDVAAAFQCAADVGTASFDHDEHTLEAAIRPLQPWSDAWACNEGWLRDDAILVLVFVTDEADTSGVTALGVEQALVTAKHDDMGAVVVLGLMGDIDQPGALCTEKESAGWDRMTSPLGEGAGAPGDLRDLVEAFGDHGLAGSVCEPSYDAFFLDAVPIIEGACEAFVAP